MDVKAYLERIDYRGPLRPAQETLERLQLAHLLAVPFENLSIHANEPIVLQEQALYDKIVARRRGGFCYELNGLFAILLRELGFDVTLLSAGVARAAGGFGPDFDHMTLMVVLGERWLVDVGFGDSFRKPLLLDTRDAQPEGRRSYQIGESGDHLVLEEKDGESAWKAQYRFTLQPREWADYGGMCEYHQTSPESSFTQRRVCSQARVDGRVTLSDMRFIETKGDARWERVLADDGEYAEVLRKEFGIMIGGEV